MTKKPKKIKQCWVIVRPGVKHLCLAASQDNRLRVYADKASAEKALKIFDNKNNYIVPVDLIPLH